MGLQMECVDCGRLTTALEANLRVFNPARCVCGGELVVRNLEDRKLTEVTPNPTTTED